MNLPPNMREITKILVSVEIEWQHGRDICKGIFRYARPALFWDFLVVPNDHASIAATLSTWKPHAVVGQFGRADRTEEALALGLPVVSLYGGRPFDPRLPQVGTDDHAIGVAAAEYLLRCGYARFAYLGLPGEGVQTGRLQGYRDALADQDHEVLAFDRQPFEREQARRDGQRADTNLVQWIRSLPKPIALLACDSLRASWAADACRHLGLRVPDQVAILGVGDDDVHCNESFPPLSAVELSAVQEGFEAARLLDGMLRGDPAPADPILLPPRGIVVRGSTDFVAIDDPNVSRALRFIQANACQGIDVNAVAREAALSRRVLEKRFRKLLNTTPHQEIRRIQIIRAQALLSETDLPTDAIAEASGFSSNIRLCTEFKKATDMTPTQFRRQFQLA